MTYSGEREKVECDLCLVELNVFPQGSFFSKSEYF